MSMRMGFELGQRMNQSQQQILSPKMYQSMEILQLPILALQERIEQELNENPVLELRQKRDDDDAPNEVNGEAHVEEEKPSDPDRDELVIDDSGEGDFDRMDNINRDWDDFFDEEHRPSRAALQEASDKKHEAMQNMAEHPQSLMDYLENQLHLVEDEIENIELVRTLIGCLNSQGYLIPEEPDEKGNMHRKHATFEDLVLSFTPPVTLEEAEEALRVVQSLDPPGVGARDLKECLQLQVGPDTPHADLVRQLIQNHLQDIQQNRLPVIQKRTGYDIPIIQEAIEILRHLNPKPGLPFTVSNNRYVVPDLAVELGEDGEYQVRLLDDWMPNVYVPRRFREMQKNRSTDKTTREFLKKHIQKVLWLQDAIEQRRNTLLKVTKAIIEHQRAFLDKGPEHIVPLKMQQIADQVEVHVTTVSRAVDDKWVETPRGVFPLKRFFGGGKQVASGEEVALELIKRKLLEIIDNEDKANPLSDEDLVKALEAEGYPIARRTVTKYRKMFSIPSSRQRKDWSLTEDE